jgi:hypothetical protein
VATQRLDFAAGRESSIFVKAQGVLMEARTAIQRYTSRPFLLSVIPIITALGTIVAIWMTPGVGISEKVQVTIGGLFAMFGSGAVFTHSELKKDSQVAAAAQKAPETINVGNAETVQATPGVGAPTALSQFPNLGVNAPEPLPSFSADNLSMGDVVRGAAVAGVTNEVRDYVDQKLDSKFDELFSKLGHSVKR